MDDITGLKKIARRFGDALGETEREKAIAYAGFLSGAELTLKAAAKYSDDSCVYRLGEHFRTVLEEEFSK